MSEIESGKPQPTYSGFLIERINEIWSLWSDGDSVRAIFMAIRLADTFIIEKIKKPMKPDVDRLKKQIARAQGVRSVDFHTSHIIRNRDVKAIADFYLVPFLSKLSDLIDKWGFYEKPLSRVTAKDFKALEEKGEPET